MNKENSSTEVMVTTNKTPIWIALGVGDDGMTTARKLYAFLELLAINGEFNLGLYQWSKVLTV